jgi:hypothetical protein
MQPSVAAISLCGLCVPVNGGDFPLKEGASLPATTLRGILKKQRSQSPNGDYLRSPGVVAAEASTFGGEDIERAQRSVRFQATAASSSARQSLCAKERALDRLTAFDRMPGEWRHALPNALPDLALSNEDRSEPAWWQPARDPTEVFWDVEMGEVAQISTSHQNIQNMKDDMLPPPYGAGYVFQPDVNPLCEDKDAVRVVFKVDSGCDPWTIVSRRLVEKAGLKTYRARSELRLPDCDTVVASEEMVRLSLRVTMNGRPHLFSLTCVVWERGALHHDMLISQTVAVKTGLSIFVHDNLLREVIMGRQALMQQAMHDPMLLPEGQVLSISGDDCNDEEEEEMFQRISPIESLRQALEPAQAGEDEWVNEELEGPLREVFEPLPKEPADVPPLEFSVQEELVRKKVYAKTKPTRLSSCSPRQHDVMAAHFKELKEAGIMGDTFPDFPPGPIASIAFPVAKPGSKRLPRPEHYNTKHPLDERLQLLHTLYTQSLTAERLVANFAPVNEVAVVQNYPLPSVKENLAKLAKFRLWAKIDLTKAFWSIPLHKNCIRWTYTIAAGGLTGVWLRAPMGLAPVPGYFMWVLTGVLSAEEAFTLLYADDILVGGNSEEELRENIRKVLATLLQRGFRVSAKKCQFKPAKEITYLGWIVAEGQIRAAPSTLDKLFSLVKPVDMVNAKDDKAKLNAVRRFLGVVQYLAHYIPCNAEELRPLYDLTKTEPGGSISSPSNTQTGSQSKPRKERAKFVWTAAADQAWDWACERLREIKPLHTPTYAFNTWLEVIADASKFGWGGILIEWTVGDPKPRIVVCVSGTFTGSQIKWPTCTKEMFGIWSTVRKLRHFLHLHHFVLSTDHRNLLWSSLSVNEMVMRMAADLHQHKFVMRHIDGLTNILCDYLSRAEYSSPKEVNRLRVAKASSEADSQRLPSPIPEQCRTASPRTRSPTSKSSKASGQCASVTALNLETKSQYCVTQNSSTSTECNSDDTCHSEVTVAGLFGIGPSSAESSCAETLYSSEEVEQFDKLSVCHGHVMPIEEQGPAMEVPQIPGGNRLGEPRRRQRRRHRVRRQPEPPLEWNPEGEDDGLPIPHMQPHPVPPPRRLTPERYHVLKSFHGGALPHTGVAHLRRALAAAGHNWEGIEEDVAEFVARCHYCQLERIIRRGPQSLPYRSVQIPSTLCECWHFDILGPLPPCAITGARCVLAAVEDTSKILMLGRAVDCNVMELMLFFLDCFKIFGLCHTIKTDRAGQYVGKAISMFLEFTGIKHEIGVAHYHQSDGIIENSAALIWPYLRVMCVELRKYHAWSPLLCNVQLGANALMRDVLGGACASEVMFNRKVKPLRFMRPEALIAADGPVEVNKFLADQAAMQLRVLGKADAERHRRFRINQDAAAFERDGQEHLDWVREGILVSIPQPDSDQHFNRPNKFAFLRRGPYQVMEVRDRTAYLRDFARHRAGRNPPTFLWPKYNMAPYYSQGDILPTLELVQQLPFEQEDEEQIASMRIPPLPSVILEAIALPADQQVIPDAPLHVRNHQYRVRWTGARHSANSVVPYEAVWSTPAFEEFVQGSTLTGHVPAQQFQQNHLRQAMSLAAGGRPVMAVPMADPASQAHVLHGYVPLANSHHPSRAGIQAALALPPLSFQRQQEASQFSDAANDA